MPSATNGSQEEGQDRDEQGQDRNFTTMRQNLENDRDRSQYDPMQDKEERREIRRGFRKLIKRTEEKRREYSSNDNLGLADILEENNELFNRVRIPQDATLDSQSIVLLSDIATQKARNLRLDHQLFSVDEFVSKIKTLGRTPTVEDGDELDWIAVGKRAIQFGKRAHSIDFMLGPLSVEKKQRKTTRQVRLVKNKEDLVQPAQLNEGDIQQQQNETSNNVNQIYKILDDHGPINYIEFITNPESFSQTVENMFYVSFLIRNAVAEIDDSGGQPILSTRAPPSVDELADNLNKKQVIMSLDIPLWKSMIETYGIRVPIIPTRHQQRVMQTDKWY